MKCFIIAVPKKNKMPETFRMCMKKCTQKALRFIKSSRKR